MERISLPKVSVIIPCGGSHHQYVGVAVASCLWQTYTNLEVIVVDDGPITLPTWKDARVTTIKSPNYGRSVPIGNRPAVARNAGVAHATGEYVVFLDADDYLVRQGIEILVRGHATHDKHYTYSSHYAGGRHQRPMDYDQSKYAKFNLHPITSLIPTAIVREIGGFDEQAPGWEDWTLYLRLAMAGYCGQYYRGPIFVYQVHQSIVHHDDVAGGQELMDRVIAPYKNEKGEIPMACCGSSNKTSLKFAVASIGEPPMVDGMYTLEYTGEQQGSFIIRHPVSKRTYKAGRAATVRYLTVPAEDVQHFLWLGNFRVVMPAPALEPAPAPAEIAEVIEPAVAEDSSVTAPTTTTTTTTVKATLRAPKKG